MKLLAKRHTALKLIIMIFFFSYYLKFLFKFTISMIILYLKRIKLKFKNNYL